MSSYLYHEQSNNVGFPRNSKLWRWCRTLNCWTPRFLELFCSLFPVLTLKIVRLTMDHSEVILSRGLADKVVLLVRDPRATFKSRSGLSWCNLHPDCGNVSHLCRDLTESHQSYQRLVTLYGEEKVRYVRYEDLVTDPLKMSRDLFAWSGLTWGESVERFISTHTTRNIKMDNPYSLYRRRTLSPAWHHLGQSLNIFVHFLQTTGKFYSKIQLDLYYLLKLYVPDIEVVLS